MVGGILVKIAFVACLVSVLSYYQHHRRGDPMSLRLGRALYIGTVGLVIAVGGVLLSHILGHEFQYTYVWNYSSRDLSTPLLISTFYAGQEGSFLLWTLFTGLIGLFLLRYSARRAHEPQVMTVFGLITLALLLMLIVKSPFRFVWETWPGEVEAGFLPANGRGLNPLLQNYWMVIHPQILFTGFAAMAVPYAYAVAALMKRDYAHWIRPATPWVVFGALQLGTGIMMGGFWAYETLGWGGYWGWDPVENSSLVPWLVSVAAIHTILSQRKSGAFIRTNLVLGMLCFLLVLYSTFLTRSGVLGDTSVHSFVDPGMWVYWLLIGMIGLFGALGFGLLIRRWKEIPKAPPRHSYLSREFALYLGSAALVFSALFVTVGTSSPIITGILYGKVTAVDMSYYVTTTLPLGIAIAFLSGIAQLLWWTRSNRSELLRLLILPGGITLLVSVMLLVTGIREIPVLLFLAGTAFTLVVNLQVGWRIVKGNPKFAGGAIAHLGLAVMFVGFVTSSKYDQKQTLSLVQGTPVEALGYTLTYVGYRPLEGEKYAFDVHISKPGGREQIVAPIMYYSAYTDGLMRNPDIANFITHDFYVAPLSLEEKGKNAGTSLNYRELRQGEQGTLGDFAVTYLGPVRPVVSTVSAGRGEPGVEVEILVREQNGSTTLLRVPPPGSPSGISFGKRHEFRLARFDADQNGKSVVGVVLQDKAAERDADILVVEAALKPWINLVWSGVLILLLGFIVTIVRRASEAAASPVEGVKGELEP